MKKSILILGLFLSSCGVFRKSPLLPLAEKTGSYDKVKLHEIRRDGRPYIQVFVNGKKANLLVDSGADVINFYQKSLQKFGFTKNAKGLIEQVINFKLSDKVALTIKQCDVAYFASKKGMDGFIGCAMLSKTKAIIDCRNRMLFFAKGDEVKKTNLDTILIKKGYSKVPLFVGPSGHIFCDAYFNGVKGFSFVDTGSQADGLGMKYKEEFGIKIDESVKVILDITVNINSGKKSTKDNTLRIGNVALKNRSFVMLDFDPYNKIFKQTGLKKEIKAVIGEKTLWKLHAIIDYGNHVLYIKK